MGEDPISYLKYTAANGPGTSGSNMHMYTLTFTPQCCFQAAFSSATTQWPAAYPTGLPTVAATGLPHYSQMAVCVHTSAYTMSASGSMASPGLKKLAEMGQTSSLLAECQNNTMSEHAFSQAQAGTPATSTSFPSFRLRASPQYSHVSFATMIAPSPDWYAYGSVNLFCGNVPCSTATTSVLRYDAGTDSGASYTTANAMTNPPASISNLKYDSTNGVGTTSSNMDIFTMTFTPDASCSRLYTTTTDSRSHTAATTTDPPLHTHTSTTFPPPVSGARFGDLPWLWFLLAI